MSAPEAPGAAAGDSLLDRLKALVGEDGVLTGADAEPYCMDVYRALQRPIAVARPATVEALRAVVTEAAGAGLALFARGGGASYTDGYLPNRPDSLIVDTGRLDRIVEINAADGFVTVEAGVTWARLKAALDPLGLRTPFFGPFSGLAATVGGSVSQNAISHGSAAHGISAESVLGLEVVIASGEVIRTGSAARGAEPFGRFYGPDLAGIFTGDCGALGIKARITLRLLRSKPVFGCASFAFASLPQMAEAMQGAAMEQLEDESFAIDAALSQGQIARQDAGAVWTMAKAVLSSSPSLGAGLVQLARMALAGTRGVGAANFMTHHIVEGVSRAEVNARIGRLRQVMAAGVEIPNTVPTIVRGLPFAPLFNTLGPRGERWVPLHGVLPYSRVAAFHDALRALYAARQSEMKRLGVWEGGMFCAVGSSGFLYEVALYWPGARTAYHEAVVPAEVLAALPTYPDDPEVNAFVDDLKQAIVALYQEFGATHFQLGKTYPFAEALAPEPLALIRAVKAALDPKGLMNPGALGL
jgi:FAD/FMN-containing dehydrogenase